MKKLNKKQKEHIKKVFVKTINIICYICTGILAVFLLIACLQSCKPKQLTRLSAESNSPRLDNISHTQWVLNETLEPTLPVQYYLNFENGADAEFTRIGSSGDSIYYQYNNTQTTAYDYDGSGWLSSADRYLYINDGVDADNVALINWFYQNGQLQNELSYFDFNKDFNYNAPLNVSVTSPYGVSVTGGVDVGTLYKKLVINTGWFISNGNYYNSIEFWYQITDGMYFDYGNNQYKQGPSSMYTYWCTYYSNSETSVLDVVNQRDIVAFMPSSTTYGYYQSNSSTWEIDNYRHLTFLDDLNESTRNRLESFNNNNQNSYSGNIISGDVNNIFTLIAAAFTAWLPVMSTYLLPGITIGTLLFIPLVALLVFAIIRVIKK